MVESQPSKLLVAGSIPVSRSNLRSRRELRLAGQRAQVAKVVHRSANREGGLSGTAGQACVGLRDEGAAPTCRP